MHTALGIWLLFTRFAAHVLSRSRVWLYQSLRHCFSSECCDFTGIHHTRSSKLSFPSYWALGYVTFQYPLPVLQCDTVRSSISSLKLFLKFEVASIWIYACMLVVRTQLLSLFECWIHLCTWSWISIDSTPFLYWFFIFWIKLVHNHFSSLIWRLFLG